MYVWYWIRAGRKGRVRFRRSLNRPYAKFSRSWYMALSIIVGKGHAPLKPLPNWAVGMFTVGHNVGEFGSTIWATSHSAIRDLNLPVVYPLPTKISPSLVRQATGTHCPAMNCWTTTCPAEIHPVSSSVRPVYQAGVTESGVLLGGMARLLDKSV